MITQRYYWLFLAAGIAILFAFQSHWSGWNREAVHDPEEIATETAGGAPLAVQGLQLVSLENGRLALGLDADLFWVRPRKYLFYQVGGEKELYVEGAHLQLHLAPDGADPASGTASAVVADPDAEQTMKAAVQPLRPLAAVTVPDSPLLDEIGLTQVFGGFTELDGVSHINIRGIDIAVFRGLRRVLMLTAETGVSDTVNGGIRFARVRLEHPESSRVLLAPVATWRGHSARLSFPEGYQEIGPWGSAQGGPASVDMDLKVVPLRPTP